MKQAIGTDTAGLLALSGVTLGDGESMLGTARIHDAIYWKGVVLAIFGILVIPTFAMSLGFFLIFVGCIIIGLAHLTRSYLVLAATDKRIFVRSGILYADLIEMRYTQTESIEVGMSLLGQLFGYGSVIVTGTGQRRLIIPFVANAIDFKKSVNDILINR